MFEIKSSFLIVLLISLSLVLLGVAGSEKKRWESVFKTILEEGGPSKYPTVSIDFVGQELEKWRSLDASQKGKLLDTGSVYIMDRISGLNEFKKDCDDKHLKYRIDLEEYYKQNYINLHPYIKFTNLMLFNSCYQEHEYKLMLSLNADLDKSKFLAWYDATEEPQFETDPSLQSLTHQDLGFERVAAKFALYLKHFYPKIESKYFRSSEEHADKIESEVREILNAVCPRITELDLVYAWNKKTPSQQPDRNIIFGTLMNDVSQRVEGFQAIAFAPIGFYKYRWICQKAYYTQLVENVQIHFGQFLDERESEDRIIADETNISEQDLVATKQILFAQNVYPQLRMGNQYDLLDRLSNGVKDGLLGEATRNIAILIQLRQLNPDECLAFDSKLYQRLEAEAIYDQTYVVLHPYVVSLNRLQFDLCNQRLRQLVSNAIPRDAAQLAKLEKLHSLIEADSHELVEPNAFAKAVADFLFSSSTSKIAKESVESKMQELLEQTCAGVTQSMSVASTLERHDALLKYGLLGPLNEATKRALSYGRICKYYEQNKLQLAAQLLGRNGWFESAPQRYPKHLSANSLLSCLKPQVRD